MCRFLVLLIASSLAGQQFRNSFFVFDNGTGRDEKIPLAEQAHLVKRTGFDGLGFTGTQHIPEVLKEMDARGLKLFSIYVAAHVDGETPSFDAGLPEAIAQLKGRDTVIWLTVQGKAPADGDRRASEIVRKIADMAAASSLRVVLYPHVGFYVDRLEVALRVRQLADRPNIGVTFNLAHFLAAGDERNLDQRLKEAAPYLQMVSINGADHAGDWQHGDWSTLIQTLDKGQFDVRGLLMKLHNLGYAGPIGLQCYRVPGDREENLKRSMTEWRKLTSK